MTSYQDGSMPGGTAAPPDPAMEAAAGRLRCALAEAEEAEARAHERAEALRVALREVEALAARPPVAGTGSAGAEGPAAPGGPGARVPSPSGAPRRASECVREVLASDRRPWAVGELVAEVARRGELAYLRDPSQAVRAAVRRMTASGELVRVGRGSYQLASEAPGDGGRRDGWLGLGGNLGGPDDDTEKEEEELV